MMKKICLIMVMFMLMFVSVTYAGPFGLEMGMKLSDFRMNKLKRIDTGIFITKIVPIPHPAFESYGLVFNYDRELCKVIAVGNTIKHDNAGHDMIRQFNSIESALAQKYGKHVRYDFLHIGSIWTGSTEWMTSLKLKQRTLSAYWSIEKNSTLPKNIDSVLLYTVGISSSDGYIRLSYEFSNFKSYHEQEKINNNKAL